jgi:cysteine desulfurase
MIYFDNAATTRPDVSESFMKLICKEFGNPSSFHGLGLSAERLVKSVSEKFADYLRVKPEEIIFTSGGTESNNLAVVGSARAYSKKGKHVITSAAEHPSVINAMTSLEKEGFEITRLPVNDRGFVEPDSVTGALRSDTILVSLMHVNNETGSITDMESIASKIKASGSNALIHTDAVQGFLKERLNLADIDMYSLSGHKVHAFKGVGALFARKNVRLAPMLFGGGQQRNIRPGTENTVGIMSLGLAVDGFSKIEGNADERKEKIIRIKSELTSLTDCIDDAYINGDPNGSPFILNMSFCDVKAETLVNALSEQEIYISAGSACNSRHPGHSSLNALSLGENRVKSAVRFSFSYNNTYDEAVLCKEAIIKTVSALRKNQKTFRGRKNGGS